MSECPGIEADNPGAEDVAKSLSARCRSQCGDCGQSFSDAFGRKCKRLSAQGRGSIHCDRSVKLPTRGLLVHCLVAKTSYAESWPSYGLSEGRFGL